MIVKLPREEERSDEEKFRCTYQQYARLAYSIALNILRQEEDAEDAVQETFIRIAKNIFKISDPFCPQTRIFVVIVCRNVSLDMLRNRKHSEVEPLSDYMPDNCHQHNPYAVSSGNDTIQTIMDVILELPDKYRDCLYMKLVEESDQKKIASILGQKLETVKKNLQRGKKILKKKLEERGMTYEG